MKAFMNAWVKNVTITAGWLADALDYYILTKLIEIIHVHISTLVFLR